MANFRRFCMLDRIPKKATGEPSCYVSCRYEKEINVSQSKRYQLDERQSLYLALVGETEICDSIRQEAASLIFAYRHGEPLPRMPITDKALGAFPSSDHRRVT